LSRCAAPGASGRSGRRSPRSAGALVARVGSPASALPTDPDVRLSRIRLLKSLARHGRRYAAIVDRGPCDGECTVTYKLASDDDLVRMGVEKCDDGNENNTDDFVKDCKRPAATRSSRRATGACERRQGRAYQSPTAGSSGVSARRPRTSHSARLRSRRRARGDRECVRDHRAIVQQGGRRLACRGCSNLSKQGWQGRMDVARVARRVGCPRSRDPSMCPTLQFASVWRRDGVSIPAPAPDATALRRPYGCAVLRAASGP